jgi:hypothetical protein
MGIHSGIAAIPKLLGSDVRKKGEVNDLGSGIREAGKGLFYGWWDGITGLATEPWQGAQKEVREFDDHSNEGTDVTGRCGILERCRSKLGQCRSSSRCW